MKTAKPRYAIYCKKPVLTQFNESEKMKKKAIMFAHRQNK